MVTISDKQLVTGVRTIKTITSDLCIKDPTICREDVLRFREDVLDEFRRWQRRREEPEELERLQ